MSAMPPPATAGGVSSGLSLVAAKLVTGGMDADAPDTGYRIPVVFSSHLQRLLGQQLEFEAALDLPTAPQAEATAETQPTDDLSALLPFMEGLGLTQPTSTVSVTADVPNEFPADNVAVALATTAISAAQPPSPGPALRLPIQSSVPESVSTTFDNRVSATTDPLAAVPNPGTTTAAPLAATPNPGTTTAALLAAVPPAGPAEADVLAASAGLSDDGEVAAQLINALSTGKETSPVSGLSQAAFQQVMSGTPRDAVDSAGGASISSSIGTAEWGEELGNRVVWLASRNESRAELVLNPPQMGRIEVNLTIKGDQATASFASNNPVVREALEAALPKLRESLAEAGIQLGQSQVSADTPRQWAQQEKHGDNSASDPARADGANPALSPVSLGLPGAAELKGGRGLVDVFA